jgi:hypothetical protein
MKTRFIRSVTIVLSISAALLCAHCLPDIDQGREIATEKTDPPCTTRGDGDAGAAKSPASPTESSSSDAGGASDARAISCMAECPSFPGCVRVAVSPNSCSNATCTGPEPECAYAQDPNSDTRCLDGEIMHATGNCIPGK